MTAIDELFARTRAENRAALVGYLPAGFPTKAQSIAAIEAMIDGGVDLVEVGLPYSDPVMDGPVVQAAAEQALAAGSRVSDVFDVVAASAAAGALSRGFCCGRGQSRRSRPAPRPARPRGSRAPAEPTESGPTP